MQPVLALTFRHYVVWSRKLPVFLCLYVLGPAILLYGLGVAFGLDAKLAFVIPGVMVNSVVVAGFIACSYGAMERFYAHRYESWMAATMNVWQIVLAEALFQGIKGVITAAGIFVAGALMGGPANPLLLLLAAPVLMLLGTCGAMLGYCLVALARSYDDITLSEPLTTAAFVFSGVFAAVSLFPLPIQIFAYLLPIYHGIELVRPLFTGVLPSVAMLALHAAALLGMTCGSYVVAARLFQRRLLG